KEFKEFYMAKKKPEILTLPPMHYIAVQWSGDPNVEGGEYQRAMEILFPLAYTLKMSYKSDYHI
ncbi:MAG: GyrI-like domain-containing protein, partial [Eubacterium aggregans]